jgi:hypothetical protein
MPKDAMEPRIDKKNFVEMFNKFKRQDKWDLSREEDLSLAVMNLLSIEEHFFFTGAKLNKPHYFELLNSVRLMRKDLLKKLVKTTEGETWCISKHLLATVMRLMECGTKQQGLDNKKDAGDFFQKAYDIYCLFWGVNLGVVDSSSAKKMSSLEINRDDEFQEMETVNKSLPSTSKSLLGRLRVLVRKVVDCCIE